ncbi:MAG: hypothetical protein Fur0022_29530 [Anaerolineales bacterium]
MTSRQQSLEQERAEAAWNSIEKVKRHNENLSDKKKYAKEYGSSARSAPADIQANGLGQTLAFWRAKGYDRGQPDDTVAQYHILEHTSVWVRKQLGLSEQQDVVMWIATQATTDQYRRATTEAIAFLIWLKRFAEAEFGKEEGSSK